MALRAAAKAAGALRDLEKEMREQEQRLSNGLCSCRAGKSAGHLFEHCRMCAKVAQTFTEAQTHVPRTLHQDRLTTAMPILFVLFRLEPSGEYTLITHQRIPIDLASNTLTKRMMMEVAREKFGEHVLPNDVLINLTRFRQDAMTPNLADARFDNIPVCEWILRPEMRLNLIIKRKGQQPLAFTNAADNGKNVMVKNAKVEVDGVKWTVKWLGQPRASVVDGLKKIACVEDQIMGKVSLDDGSEFQNDTIDRIHSE